MSDSDRVIGNVATVAFPQFNRELECKVDTGATTSSIHAEDIRIEGESVIFACPMLSDNTIRMKMHDVHAVQSADGGSVKRPVVLMNVDIEGVSLKSQEFNLNDRSDMEAGVLLGQNVLQAGHFKIDVKEPVAEPDDPSETGDTIRESKDSVDDYVKLGEDCLVTLTKIGGDSITTTMEELVRSLKRGMRIT